jgi:hypothetical protein
LASDAPLGLKKDKCFEISYPMKNIVNSFKSMMKTKKKLACTFPFFIPSLNMFLNLSFGYNL